MNHNRLAFKAPCDESCVEIEGSAPRFWPLMSRRLCWNGIKVGYEMERYMDREDTEMARDRVAAVRLVLRLPEQAQLATNELPETGCGGVPL